MKKSAKKTSTTASPPERCDTRVWSGECSHSSDVSGKKENLCVTCGTIHKLDHEVHHEEFPHVSGDTDNLY
jgi:hypothetical protein